MLPDGTLSRAGEHTREDSYRRRSRSAAFVNLVANFFPGHFPVHSASANRAVPQTKWLALFFFDNAPQPFLDELSQRNGSARRELLCLLEQRVRNLDGGLHKPILPYPEVWEYGLKVGKRKKPPGLPGGFSDLHRGRRLIAEAADGRFLRLFFNGRCRLDTAE